MIKRFYAWAIPRIFRKWLDDGELEKTQKFFSYTLSYSLNKKRPYRISHNKTPRKVLKFEWRPTFDILMDCL